MLPGTASRDVIFSPDGTFTEAVPALVTTGHTFSREAAKNATNAQWQESKLRASVVYI